MANQASEGAVGETRLSAGLSSRIPLPYIPFMHVLRYRCHQLTSARSTRGTPVKRKSYKKSYTRVQDYYLNGDDKRTRSYVYRVNGKHALRETD